MNKIKRASIICTAFLSAMSLMAPASSFAASAKLGDINGDGMVNAADASAILVAYSLTSTGNPSGLTAAQTTAGDVNGDGFVNAVDASKVLSYYSYVSTGGTLSPEEFMGTGKKYSADGYVAQEDTVIEGKRVTLMVQKGCYIRKNAADEADRICEALEAVTGLSFTEGSHGFRPKVEVLPVDMTPYPDENPDCDLGYAGAFIDTATLSRGDLFICKNYAIAHELAHVLHNANCDYEKYSGHTLSEGFAQYCAWKAMEYLHENYPAESAAYFDTADSALGDVYIDGDEMFDKPMEYWILNDFPYSGNGHYSTGLRLMAYFNDKYGDFTSWMKDVDKNGVMIDIDEDGNLLYDDNIQIGHIKNTYGEDCLEGFYPWLKKNADMFEADWEPVFDYTGIHELKIMPECISDGNYFSLVREYESVKYDDLTVDLSEGIFYLEKVKNKDMSGITLTTDSGIELELYNKYGRLIKTCKGGKDIPLGDAVAVRLPGKGIVGTFEIDGFERNLVEWE